VNIDILHERQSQNLRVQLVWNSETGSVYVTVFDGFDLIFIVAPESADALDAFYHPFGYTAAPEDAWGLLAA